MTLMVSLFTDVDEEMGIAPPCIIEHADSDGVHHGGDAMTMKTQILERFKLQS